jgi:Uma2 family endonuclease
MSAMHAPTSTGLRMTEAEYLAFEAAADAKHEFVDGLVYDWPGNEAQLEALAGASRRHNRLQTRLLALLDGPARAAGSAVVGSDQRLRLRAPDAHLQAVGEPGAPVLRYYYPDVQLLCDARDLADLDQDALDVEHPCVVVEIASRSSVRLDQIEKRLAYQSTASVRAYLVVHQPRALVEYWWRDQADVWQGPLRLGPGDSVELPCIDSWLAVADVYAGLQLVGAEGGPA